MAAAVDCAATVGSVQLPHAVMTASGTAGHGDELASYVDLSRLGAVVVKSLSAEPWAGNPGAAGAPDPGRDDQQRRAAGARASRPGPTEELPALIATGARVVVSIWGRSIADYADAAAAVASLPPEVVAVEVNVSCPNVEARHEVFAHSVEATRAVLDATAGVGRPRWAKLSPNVTDLVSIATAAADAGVDAVTLVNTVMGMVIDIEARRPLLGGGGGGLSGPAMHPVAVRAVHDVHAALPHLPIVGVGGVASGAQAIELMMAGASAVQVGTATFADPRASAIVMDEIEQWCRTHGVDRLGDLVGAAHDERLP